MSPRSTKAPIRHRDGYPFASTNALRTRSIAYEYKELELYHELSRLHPWISTSTVRDQNSPTTCERVVLPKSNTATSAGLPLPKPKGPAKFDSGAGAFSRLARHDLKDGLPTELSVSWAGTAPVADQSHSPEKHWKGYSVDQFALEALQFLKFAQERKRSIPHTLQVTNPAWSFDDLECDVVP